MDNLALINFKESLLTNFSDELPYKLQIKEEIHLPSNSILFSVRTINSPLLNFTFRIVGEKEELKYIIITGLFIEPQNTGLGSRLMLIFFTLSKIHLNIEKIYLNPKSLRAERFWSNHGFSSISSKEPLACYGYNKVKKI